MMKWGDLSDDAQAILEWQEHVLTGKPQKLVIKRGEEFYQRCAAFSGDVRVFVTDELFDEIKSWVPHDLNINYTVDGDTIITDYKDEIKAKLN